MKTLKFATACFCLIGATLLIAESLPTRGPLPFSAYDKDNNNVITVKEFDAIKQQRMNQKANSGKMMRNAGNSPTFSDIDTNNDGIVTKEELQIHQQKRFTNKMNTQGGKGMQKGQGRTFQ